MKTPGNSRPSSNASRGAWKESYWVPNAFLSISASIRGPPPSLGSASRIAPAQVPSTALESSDLIQSNRAGRREEAGSFPVRLIVVDSPPGMTTACGSDSIRSEAFLSSLISISIPALREASINAAMWEWRAP